MCESRFVERTTPLGDNLEKVEKVLQQRHKIHEHCIGTTIEWSWTEWEDVLVVEE